MMQTSLIPAADTSRHTLNLLCCGVGLMTNSASFFLICVLIGELHTFCKATQKVQGRYASTIQRSALCMRLLVEVYASQVR